MIKISKLFSLIIYFVKTEIISGIELIIWFGFRDLFTSLMNLENDFFGIRHGVLFVLIVIPIISAIHDYHKNKRQIDSLFFR